jgi:hypothetical protein
VSDTVASPRGFAASLPSARRAFNGEFDTWAPLGVSRHVWAEVRFGRSGEVHVAYRVGEGLSTCLVQVILTRF